MPHYFSFFKWTYLEVVGEANCLDTHAGDSGLLTGDPYPGDAVLLSLRRRCFWKQIGSSHKIWKPAAATTSDSQLVCHVGVQGSRTDLGGVGCGLRASLKTRSTVICRGQCGAERWPVRTAGCWDDKEQRCREWTRNINTIVCVCVCVVVKSSLRCCLGNTVTFPWLLFIFV